MEIGAARALKMLMRVDRKSSRRVILAMNRIEGRPEAGGFWTKKRSSPDLWLTLPVGIALLLLHSGWYNLVLVAVIALGGLIALALRRTLPAAPGSIL